MDYYVLLTLSCYNFLCFIFLYLALLVGHLTYNSHIAGLSSGFALLCSGLRQATYT